MSPETRRLHEGIIRGLITVIRAWQDWLKAKAPPDGGAAVGTGDR